MRRAPTGAMNGPVSERPSLAPVLAFSAFWAAEVAYAVPDVPSVTGFIATFGMTSVTLAAITSALGTPGEKPSPWIRGAALVAGPLALLATVLREKTHHRALGGVTFAVLAAVLVAASVLVVRRLDRLGARGVQTALLTVSLVVAVRPLVTGHSEIDALVRRDFSFLVVLSALAVVATRRGFGSGLGRLTTPLFVASVVAGFVVSQVSLPLRAILAERAPFAFGVGTLLGP